MGTTLVRCSLFVDTDGLSDADSGANLFDASTSDVAIQEASLDGNSGDAAIATEAGFPGCDGGHVACDDFETSSFDDRWNNGNVYGGGFREYADDASVSPTHSFHSSAPINPSGAGAALYQDLNLPTRSFHCQLDVIVRVQAPEVLAVGFSGADGGGVLDYYVSVSLGDLPARTVYVVDLVDGGTLYDFRDSPEIPTDAWTHITLDMAPSGSQEVVTLVVGNSAPIVRNFLLPIDSPLTRIQVAEDYSPVGFDELIDNVICDVVP